MAHLHPSLLLHHRLRGVGGPQLPGRIAGRQQRGALFPCPGPLPRSTKKRRGKGLGCARLGLVAAVAAAARPWGLAWGCWGWWQQGAWQQGVWQHASVCAGSRGLSVSAGCVGTVPHIGAQQRCVMLLAIQSQGPGAAQGSTEIAPSPRHMALEPGHSDSSFCVSPVAAGDGAGWLGVYRG